MPRRSPIRRIVRPSRPSASRISRAAETISRARALSGSGAQVAIARAHPVADGAVECHVEAPGQRADEPGAGQGERRDGEQRGAPEGVRGVVDRNGAGMEPALLESAADAEQECEVWYGEEAAELPDAAAIAQDLRDGAREERCCERGVGD